MTSVIASNVFDVLSRSVEAMTSKDIAVNKDNCKVLENVAKDAIQGALILGCCSFIYKGIKCIVDNNNLIDMELVQDSFKFSLKTHK